MSVSVVVVCLHVFGIFIVNGFFYFSTFIESDTFDVVRRVIESDTLGAGFVSVSDGDCFDFVI